MIDDAEWTTYGKFGESGEFGGIHNVLKTSSSAEFSFREEVMLEA